MPHAVDRLNIHTDVYSTRFRLRVARTLPVKISDLFCYWSFHAQFLTLQICALLTQTFSFVCSEICQLSASMDRRLPRLPCYRCLKCVHRISKKTSVYLAYYRTSVCMKVWWMFGQRLGGIAVLCIWKCSCFCIDQFCQLAFWNKKLIISDCDCQHILYALSNPFCFTLFLRRWRKFVFTEIRSWKHRDENIIFYYVHFFHCFIYYALVLTLA